MATLGDNCYGKARVRVMKVVRHATHHAMKEWNVRVLLHGDFESCFTEGDNSKILPTDTMKNTVYYLARESNAATLEEFATELVEYLLSNNPQVSKAVAEIEEKSWERVPIDGSPHATTYTLAGPEQQTVEAILERGSSLKVTSGIDGLVILKSGRYEGRNDPDPRNSRECRLARTVGQGARSAAIAVARLVFRSRRLQSVRWLEP